MTIFIYFFGVVSLSGIYFYTSTPESRSSSNGLHTNNSTPKHTLFVETEAEPGAPPYL
ncbi:hypothetical protein BDV38DRAFT_244957 [Aspergillus pseudotamarii]|uniref:Uncharacterized protein n=1 Tax=Aspergillus pseudotamarii TaxID=132259 RepID=A0A5N6SYS3_ASPPS|nr:uncharacterized protein BDV38DRAFT_244957 [Aspergillus pseudotamarii]KAE8138254.1 hypothetical protein BDV38DRAFT_244957 [Aspergillus pseudotamarii]